MVREPVGSSASGLLCEPFHLVLSVSGFDVQLANVISDISRVTGMAILRAMVADERDPHRLSTLKYDRMRTGCEEISRRTDAAGSFCRCNIMESLCSIHPTKSAFLGRT